MSLLLFNPQAPIVPIALTDDFNDNVIDAAKWTRVQGAGDNSVETGGQLVMSTVASTTQYHGYTSVSAYNYTGKSTYVKLVSLTNPTLVNGQAFLKLYPDASNSLVYFINNGNLVAQKQVASVDTTLSVIAFNSTNHKWLRIRELGGTTYFDYSADGLTYTNQFNAANPITMTALTPQLGVGTFASETLVMTATWDNFNTTGGTAYSSSLTASMSMAGVMSKRTIRSITAGITSSGTVTKIPIRSLTAALTSVGSVLKLTSRNITGSLPFVGALSRRTNKTLTATLATVGALSVRTNKALTAVLTTVGSLSSRANKIFSATLTSSGSLVKSLSRNITASLSTSGTLVKRTISTLTGGLTLAGVVSSTKVSLVNLVASITPTGAISKRVSRSITASLTPTGAIAKRLARLLSATLTSSGTLVKRAIRSLTGGLTSSGLLTRRANKTMTGTLTSSGSITRRINKGLTGGLSFVGSVAKGIFKAFTAAVGFVGGLVKGIAGIKVYYVSTTGSDAADGLTAVTAWQTIAKVNATTLFAGDTVLFKAGETFTGNLTINANGTSVSPITINSYGTGQATISSTADNGISCTNKSGIAIKNLIITGGPTAKTTSSGIVFFANDLVTHDYILIDNVTVSEFSNGVSIGCATGASKFNNVTVQNSTFHNNRDSGMLTYAQDAFVPATPVYAVTNITVTNCLAYDNKGNVANTTTNSGNGIVLGRVSTGLIDLCRAYGNGVLCPCATEGPVGLWTYRADSVIIQRSVSYANGTASIPDGDGFDLDLSAVNCTIQYCLAYSNGGAGILVYGAGNNNTVRYNICWGNGTNTLGTPFGEFAMGGGCGSTAVYNNTFISRDATTNPAVLDLSGSIAGTTVRNNLLYAGTGRNIKTDTAYTTGQVFMQNNNYYRASGMQVKWGASTYTTLDLWRAAVPGQEQISGSNVGSIIDPIIHAPSATPTVTTPTDLSGAFNYKLQDTSPLIGQGSNLNTLFGTNVGIRDFFNTTLTTIFDLGATIAHFQTPSVITPLQAAIGSLTNLFTNKGSATSTKNNSKTNIANAKGGDILEDISGQTKDDTLESGTNQTKI